MAKQSADTNDKEDKRDWLHKLYFELKNEMDTLDKDADTLIKEINDAIDKQKNN